MPFKHKLSHRLAIMWLLAASMIVTACELPTRNSGTEPPPPPGTRVGYYVTPTGSSTGDGSTANPWTLAIALAHPSSVQPGDTIWLRGGTYRGTFASRLQGTGSAPIIVRQYPGERATIDGNLVIQQGGYTWFWGFEVMSSANPPMNVTTVAVHAPGTKLINLVVHDAGGNGIGFWLDAVDAETYGSIIYNNGTTYNRTQSMPSHGMYIQNDAGTKLVAENILFNNSGYDLHIYGTAAPLRNMTFEGNVGLSTTEISLGWLLRTDNSLPHENLIFRQNMIYGTRSANVFTLGPNAPAGHDLTFVENYVWGGTAEFKNWANLTLRDNSFLILANRLSSPTSSYPPYNYDANAYVAPSGYPNFRSWLNDVGQPDRQLPEWQSATGYDRASTLALTSSGKPAANCVFVRPNRYEAGRANIVVYNWENLPTITVDVSGVLKIGDRYEVRNVLDFFGPPVLSSTYGGSAISIPMTAVAPPTPLLGWWTRAAPTPGPEFGVLVLRVTGS